MATLDLRKYLQTANKIIGKRTAAEIAYDNEVIRWFDVTKDIRAAIAKANEKYPAEALEPEDSQYPDLQARYEYIKGHELIVRKLRK